MAKWLILRKTFANTLIGIEFLDCRSAIKNIKLTIIKPRSNINAIGPEIKNFPAFCHSLSFAIKPSAGKLFNLLNLDDPLSTWSLFWFSVYSLSDYSLFRSILLAIIPAIIFNASSLLTLWIRKDLNFILVYERIAYSFLDTRHFEENSKPSERKANTVRRSSSPRIVMPRDSRCSFRSFCV